MGVIRLCVPSLTCTCTVHACKFTCTCTCTTGNYTVTIGQKHNTCVYNVHVHVLYPLTRDVLTNIGIYNVHAYVHVYVQCTPVQCTYTVE